jgi:Ca2+-binding RTX toxin-like protein
MGSTAGRGNRLHIPLWAPLVVAACLLAPGSAGAAALSTDTAQGRYYYLPANGEANTLTIDADASNYTFTDSVAIADTNSACIRLSANSLQCPRNQGATAMHIRADLAFPPLFQPFDTAPNTFRYNGPPPPGTATEPGLRVETALTKSNDDIAGSSGNDLIRSYGGNDTVVGGGGDDEITDDGGDTGTFSGGDGNDKILASGGDNQTIYGGEGDDSLDGGDKMFGEGGNDTLHNNGDFGGLIGDLLDGGAGNDALVEEGDSNDCPNTVADTNIGGPGQDTVYDDCGSRDIFKLTDGEPDKWHCGGTTGIADLDPKDVLVSPQLLCDRGPGVVIKFPKIKNDTARFKLVSENKAAQIECRLDYGPFKRCPSTVKYKNLRDGRHAFQARAVAGSLIGKTAKYKWTI